MALKLLLLLALLLPSRQAPTSSHNSGTLPQVIALKGCNQQLTIITASPAYRYIKYMELELQCCQIPIHCQGYLMSLHRCK